MVYSQNILVRYGVAHVMLATDDEEVVRDASNGMGGSGLVCPVYVAHEKVTWRRKEFHVLPGVDRRAFDSLWYIEDRIAAGQVKFVLRDAFENVLLIVLQLSGALAGESAILDLLLLSRLGLQLSFNSTKIVTSVQVRLLGRELHKSLWNSCV